MPPHNPPRLVACPFAVIAGWGVEHGSGRWFFKAGGELTGALIAKAFPRCPVRRAVSLRVLCWGVTFRYGRPIPARVVTRTADEFMAAISGFTGTPDAEADMEFLRRIRREQAERN